MDKHIPAFKSSHNVDELFTKHKRLTDTLYNELKALTGPYPRMLYHYTDADAFLGILENSELRASNALYLDDATEPTHKGGNQ